MTQKQKSLEDQIKELRKRLSEPKLTLEISIHGTQSRLDRERDHAVVEQIKSKQTQLESARKKQIRQAFAQAREKGRAKQAFRRAHR